MDIVFSEECLEYSYFGHIESPQRVREAIDIFRGKGHSFIKPDPASQRDLLRVHSDEWVDRVKAGGFFDADTPGGKNIYKYAVLSAGGAIRAAEVDGFSLLRPPGHHAGKNGVALGASSLGFCYFNNIAVAIKKLGKPAMVLDIDGHHGNGTQEIFLGDPNVTFISIHQSPQYPGTGLASDMNCLNFPLPYNAGDRLYLKTLQKTFKQVNNMDEIEVVGISAGFDAHEGDIASLGLTSRCYTEIGERISKLKKKVFGVLEGGYSGENIGADLNNLIQGLQR